MLLFHMETLDTLFYTMVSNLRNFVELKVRHESISVTTKKVRVLQRLLYKNLKGGRVKCPYSMKNTHLEHPEDEILTGDLSVLNWFTAKSKITVKIDGAPAIVFGTNPENGKFFVGTKSVFNKVKIKINYSVEDILRNHGNNVRVSEILIACFHNLPRISGIIQGDFIGYGGSDTYCPNTITYKFPKVITKPIIFAPHTTYSGSNLRDCSASFGAKVRACSTVLWVRPRVSLIEDREDILDFCNFARQMSTLCEFVSEKEAVKIKKEINLCIRENRKVCEYEIAERCNCDKNLIRLWKLVESIKMDLFFYIRADRNISCEIDGRSSEHEGYVITNKFGSYKVVNRTEFSRLNFTLEKSWS